MVFLPRHGKGHRLLPSEVNYRANMYGMKKLGVERIISVSAVGSMKEEIAPGHIVIPDQFIDRTRGSERTPFSATASWPMSSLPTRSARDLSEDALCRRAGGGGDGSHGGEPMSAWKGPAFSTRAESLLYRGFGVSVIGMTNLTEAKLAREAEICYGAIALSTDYDCWHEPTTTCRSRRSVAIISRTSPWPRTSSAMPWPTSR